jgi:hypothetical protein
MKKLKADTKRILGLFLGWFPHKLPVGAQELQDFTTWVLATYRLPDLISYRNALATMILHLGPTTCRKPPRFFAICIRKAMSNQVAYEFLHPEKVEKTLEVVPDSAG